MRSSPSAADWSLSLPAIPPAWVARQWAVPRATYIWPPFLRGSALVPMAIVLSALYAGGAVLTFAALENPEAGAAFFPAAGLTLSLLVLSPVGTWPLWLAAVGATEIIVDVSHGQSVAMAAGFAVANTLEPLVGAVGILWFTRGELRRDFVVFLACVAVATLCGAVVGATTSIAAGSGGSWLSVVGNWWLGDALGVVVVGVLVLAWARPAPFQPVAHPLELAALVAIAVGIAIVPALVWHHPVIYAVLPILTWAALRGGTRAVALTGAAVAFATNWAVLTGHASHLVVDGTDRTRLVLIQVFLGVTLVSSTFLAVEVRERRRNEILARRADDSRAAAEVAAARRAEAARRRIALDAHDIVGHALSVMLVQAGAARRVIHDRPAAAEELLSSMEEVGRAAFHDLDRALELADPERSTGPQLDRIADLVAALDETGIDITLDQDPACSDVPDAVGVVVYRVVQEALTNVMKHAPGARVDVCVECTPSVLVVSVSNTLTLAHEPGNERRGRGLEGIRDRVRALGGRVMAEVEGDRFVVRASLPLEPVSVT